MSPGPSERTIREPESSTLVLRTVTRLLTPVIVALSVYLLLRGHNAPGGGFIASLVAGAGIVLRYLSLGPDALRPGRLSFGTLLTSGLGLASASMLIPLAFGEPIGRGTVWYPALAGATFKLPSSLVFDVGVYLVVVAVVVAIVRFLGEDQP